MPNSLAGNAADLLPCLSDDFGFLRDAETTGPGAGRLRNLYIINDKEVRGKVAKNAKSCRKLREI